MNRYSNPGILPRAKGARLEKNYFAFVGEGTARGLPFNSVAKEVGSGKMACHYGGEPVDIYFFEVTLARGTVVPAYKAAKSAAPALA